MIIDTHAHLCDKRYKKTLKQIIRDLHLNNVSHVFTISYNKKSIKQNLKIARKHKNIYAVIGFHPSDIAQLNAKTLKWLEKKAKHKKVVAIGEIGLDYHYTTENKQQQFDGFLKQLQLANKLSLPIVIHTRDASTDLLNFLTEHKSLLNNGGIVHCFADDFEFYEKVNSLSLIISVGGTITFKNSKTIVEALKDIPLTSIVLETDSPYLTPMPYRGKTNEPKHTNLVAKKLSEIKQVDVLEIEKITNQNVENLFKKFIK